MENDDRKVVLQAKAITKNFYHPTLLSILNGVSLSLKQGETAAIMGRSGEGKSTLLHILGTLEPPCSGNLWIAGQEVTASNKSSLRGSHIGFIFQSFHLLEDYTVMQNVLMPAFIARRSISKGSNAYQRAEQLLEKVGLPHRAHYTTKLLSGGERQRVAIARALCNDPDIILADEPSGNLDRQTSMAIHELLLSFAHENNKSLLTVTHNKELASLCQTRYQLQEGVLVL